jgi:hypothetical protein
MYGLAVLLDCAAIRLAGGDHSVGKRQEAVRLSGGLFCYGIAGWN